MIISHSRQFVFIKTRKTAGTSIEVALSRYCDEGDVITELDPEDEELRREIGCLGPQNFIIPVSKMTAREWVRLMRRRRRPRFYYHVGASRIRAYLGDRRWQSYFSFCVERNPWDKVISFWHFARENWWRDRNDAPSLHDFIMSDRIKEISEWRSYSSRDKVIVDHVARYENLTKELEAIWSTLGLCGAPDMPRAKGSFRGDRRPYREVLTGEEAGRIATVFAREIEYFGYRF